MRTVVRFLKPGGLLLVQGSLGEDVYTVGSSIFPVMNIDEPSFRRVVQECGLEVEKWTLCTKESTYYFSMLSKPE